MIIVDVRELGIPQNAAPFANGAVGELYRPTTPVASLPGRTLVFKRIKLQKDLPSGLDRNRVLAQTRSVVAMRDSLSPGELAELDEVSVWPLAMVQERGKDIGILLDLIAPEFYVDTKPAGGPVGRALFELQFLCVSAGYFQKTGIDPAVTGDGVMRLALSARLANAIEIVHRRPIVFGDLHLKNAVAAAKPFARVLLMDCDSAAELSDNSRVQLHGPGFAPPEIRAKQQQLQDQKTDVYKLGLCIIKALSPGKGATQATDPARTAPGLLDPAGIDLLRRAVGDDRDQRPTAAQLKDYLVTRVSSLITLPILHSAELSHRVALRGSDVFVRWDQEHGTEVRVFGTNGYSVAGIDLRKFATGYAIQPKAGGPIEVEVWNQHGPSKRVHAGFLDYYELPSLDIASQVQGLPRPVIPEVPALDASAFDALEPYPVAVHPDLHIELTAPALEFPALTIDVGHGPPGARFHPGPAPTLERATRRANERIEKSLRAAMRRIEKSLSELGSRQGT